MDNNKHQPIARTGAANGAVVHHDEAHPTDPSLSDGQEGLHEQVERLRVDVEHLLDQQKALQKLRNRQKSVMRSRSTKAMTRAHGIPVIAADFSIGVRSD